MKHFGAVTPVELVKKILRPGEIQGLYSKISEHCGYGRTVVEDLKKKIDTDPEVATMFYLFQRWGILPGEYYGRPIGERLMIQAFILRITQGKG